VLLDGFCERNGKAHKMNKHTIRYAFDKDEIVVCSSLEERRSENYSGEIEMFYIPKLNCPFTIQKDCERGEYVFESGKTYIVHKWPKNDPFRGHIKGIIREKRK